MLKVQKHGQTVRVLNPVTGAYSNMVKVTFTQEGRSGAISSLSASSDFLDSITGEKTGLDQIRVHTHLIKLDKIDLFPVGKAIDGHINRKLFSQAQMEQQENVQSRMVDGQPTYFTTYLDSVERPDVDYRMTNETLAHVDPEAFRNTRTRSTTVTVLHEAEAIAEAVAGEETLAG